MERIGSELSRRKAIIAGCYPKIRGPRIIAIAATITMLTTSSAAPARSMCCELIKPLP
jgi:hypothetical protein